MHFRTLAEQNERQLQWCPDLVYPDLVDSLYLGKDLKSQSSLKIFHQLANHKHVEPFGYRSGFLRRRFW